jgi:hypothetical protein
VGKSDSVIPRDEIGGHELWGRNGMTVVSLDMAYRSFRGFWQARHPPRYAAFNQTSSPRFALSSQRLRANLDPGVATYDEHARAKRPLARLDWDRGPRHAYDKAAERLIKDRD